MADHFHIYHGEPVEDDIEQAVLQSTEPMTTSAMITEVVQFLTLQLSVLKADQPIDFESYRAIKGYLRDFDVLTADKVQVIEQCGMELVVGQNEFVSILPCDGACEQ